MEYRFTTLNEEITREQIVTVHYFEFLQDYRFTGERHNFWEFLYVDKGTIIVCAEDLEHILKRGDIIFHKPNEWHNNIANGQIAPNVVVIAFACNSPSMRFFENRVLQIGDAEKNLMAKILREAGKAFSSRLDDPFSTFLEKRENSPFGSEQMIKISLEQMLLQLIRRHDAPTEDTRLSTSVKENSEQDILAKILSFLQQNVRSKISLDDVCAHTLFSRSYIQRLFKHQMGTSIMDYYKHLKIDEAKMMIREGKYNFTQISELLSYASIHHFSRHFKEITDMTPSEYASSVKVKI